MTSQWFQPTIRDYQRPAIERWVGRWWWVAALMIILSSLLAWTDIRFLLVTLLIILVIIPAGILNVYLFSLLSPTLRSRLHYQRVEVRSGEWVRVYYSYPPDDEDLCPLPDEETIPWDMVKSISRRGTVWVVRFKEVLAMRPGFISIPRESVDEDISYPLDFD